MTTTLQPLTTGLTRVWLIEGRARVDHAPSYENTMRLAALSQAFGDITRIEVPDPNRYGQYIEIGEIRGASERATVTLEGRYAFDLKSTLLRLAREGCQFDVQLHMGKCQDPSNFDDFEKVLILEGAAISTYNTDDLGSLASGDNAEVNENVDLSVKDAYEVVKLSFAQRAASVVVNEVTDIVICGNPACGNDCDDENDGCKLVIAVTVAAGGSPATIPDIVFSNDNGATFVSHDIDTLTASEDTSGVACLGQYVIVISGDIASLTYDTLTDLTAGGDPAFTEVATGFVAGGEPLAIDTAGSKAFIVGKLGYIYSTTDPTGGVTNDDAGSAVTDDLNAVSAYSETFAVAVGNAGAIAKTEDGAAWTSVVSPVGVGTNFVSVAVKSEDEWLLGTDDGRMFYTNDGGTNFTLKSFPGSGSGVVEAIEFSSPSVGYMSHSTALTKGRILRTYNGGQSWVVLPEGTGTLPTSDKFNALAVCPWDVNLVYGAGLADDASDGIILRGAG